MGKNKKGLPSGIVALVIIIGSYVLMRHVAKPPLPSNLVSFFMIFVVAGVVIYITLDDKRIEEFLNFISLRSKEPIVYDLIRKGILVLIPFFIAYTVYSNEKIRYFPPAELFQPHVTPPQWVVTFKIPDWVAAPDRCTQLLNDPQGPCLTTGEIFKP